MNRRELARNGILGLFGFVCGKLPSDRKKQEPVTWTTEVEGVWNMETPDGHLFLTVDARPKEGHYLPVDVAPLTLECGINT